MSDHPMPPQRQTRMTNVKWIGALVLMGLVCLLLGATGMGIYKWATTNRAPITTRPGVQNDGNRNTTDQENVIANVVEKVSPSVVSITTNVQQQSVFGVVQGQAAGTGVVVSADGYVLTNKHVLADANAVQVVTSDGTAYTDVKIVGSDPLNDVAFLKINGAKNLTAAELGDSSTLRVGQEIIAIGNSLGQYHNTVTSGIISGKGRPIQAGDGNGQSTENLTDLLQTDAAINPGNSGGPLLNRSGQVVGINTAVAQNAEGIGFAIPINATKGALKSVLAGDGVRRAYIGLRYVPLSPEVAKQYNVSVRQGAYIVSNGAAESVQSGGPADKAGIKEKDILTKINGLEIGQNGGMSSLIGEYAPGDTITVDLLRAGQAKQVKVTLGSYGSN